MLLTHALQYIMKELEEYSPFNFGKYGDIE